MREHTAVCVVYCEGFTVGRILISLSLVCNASLLANGIEVPVHPLLSVLVHSGWWVVYAFWCVVLSYPPLGMVFLPKETTGLRLVMVIKQFLLREGRRPGCSPVNIVRTSALKCLLKSPLLIPPTILENKFLAVGDQMWMVDIQLWTVASTTVTQRFAASVRLVSWVGRCVGKRMMIFRLIWK